MWRGDMLPLMLYQQAISSPSLGRILTLGIRSAISYLQSLKIFPWSSFTVQLEESSKCTKQRAGQWLVIPCWCLLIHPGANVVQYASISAPSFSQIASPIASRFHWHTFSLQPYDCDVSLSDENCSEMLEAFQDASQDTDGHILLLPVSMVSCTDRTVLKKLHTLRRLAVKSLLPDIKVANSKSRG